MCGTSSKADIRAGVVAVKPREPLAPVTLLCQYTAPNIDSPWLLKFCYTVARTAVPKAKGTLCETALVNELTKVHAYQPTPHNVPFGDVFNHLLHKFRWEQPEHMKLSLMPPL